MTPRPDSLRLPRSRGALVVALAIACLIGAVIITWPAWAGPRVFPALPVFDFWRTLPGPWNAIIVTLIGALFLAAVFLPEKRILLAAAVAGAVLICLQDQVRWQPWVFQFLVMLALAAAASGRDDPSLLAAWRIFLIATYFWTGLCKFGPGFEHLYTSSFIQPLRGRWPAALISFMEWQGPLVGWIETATAVGLCFRRTRTAAALLAVGTHVFILLIVGPLGTATNEVIWPWNAVIAAMVLLLFVRTPSLEIRALFRPGFRTAAAFLITLVTVTPLLGRMGKWDQFLSFQLYSGTDRRLMIVLPPACAEALPPELRPWLVVSAVDPTYRELRFFDWSLKELKFPVPSEDRILLALGHQFATIECLSRGPAFFHAADSFLAAERGFDQYLPGEMFKMRSFPPYRHRLPKK
jgi:hypothetical protein